MPLPLTALGLEYLSVIPVRLRDDPDVMSIMHVYAREAERVRATREALTAGLVSPAKADARVLPLWERLLGLPVAPAGVTVTVRQSRAVAYLIALRQSGTGRWWEEAVGQIAGAGWSYTEAGSGVVNVALPFATSTAAFAQAAALIGRITDAHITLNFTSTLSFKWDSGRLDDEAFA